MSFQFLSEAFYFMVVMKKVVTTWLFENGNDWKFPKFFPSPTVIISIILSVHIDCIFLRFELVGLMNYNLSNNQYAIFISIITIEPRK